MASPASPGLALLAAAPHTGAAHPFLLDAGSAFVVEEGRVDLFFVRVTDGRPDGHRTHLLRVPAGSLILGFDPPLSDGGRGVLVVGAIGTQVAHVAPHALREALATPDRARVVHDLIEAWIEALCGAIARGVPPTRSHELQAGDDITVSEPVAARPRRPVAWVAHADGRSHLLGKDALAIDTDVFVPVSRRVWLEVQPGSRLRIADTGSLEAGDILDGVARLSRLALRGADLMTRETEAAERERLQQRVAFQESVLRQACGELTAAVMPQDGGGAATADMPAEDALLAACRTAAHAPGIVIKPYPRVSGMAAPRDPLAAIARTSRVRLRRVALRGAWWRHDHGPLVGVLAEGKSPVALLPSPHGYVLHEPGSAPRRIGAALAATVAPFAHTFYRPFHDGPLRVQQVLSFALRGTGRDVGVLVAVSVAASILGMLPSLAAGIFFNTLIPGAHRVELIQLSVVLFASACAAFLLAVAQGIVFLRIEARAGTAVQAAVWDRLLTLPLAFFRPYTAGDLAVRAMSVEGIRQAIAGPTATTLIAGLCSLGNVALMFYYNARLARWAVSILVAAAALTLLAIYWQVRYHREALRLQARVSGLVLQLLGSIGKLRVAGVERSAFAVWARRFTAERRLRFRVRAMAGWVTAFHAAVPVLANLVIFWVALPLADAGLLRTGDFLGFLAAFSTCVAALASSCMALVAVGTVVPFYDQVRPILEAEPEVATSMADPGLLTGDIEIQHAAFRYSADTPLVLRDLSLRIRPGEFVALVGPSGSGKSTLLRLLLGFEQLDSGAVYFDGQDLTGLDINVVRRQIGVVLQNGRLMSGDIFTNIVGSSTATLAEAWEAARMAGFAEDVEAMPMGMHTVIADGGGTLSGGQRQRLLIARAIVHRPRIVLFDEATSALDNRTQAIVSASLERLQATRIVVAHRLSTVRNADRLYVLERGALVQSGTYSELMARAGPFAELARRQIA